MSKPLAAKLTLIIMGLLLVLTPCPAEAKKRNHHTHQTHGRAKRHGRAPVASTASYADIIINAQTGEILHASSPDSLRHPASLTKMMTLYLAFQAIEAGRLTLDQYLPVSYNAAQQPPSKLGLRAGQKIMVEDAIMGLVTESANDAAMVLGEWMGGSAEDFALLMTKQARALGMTRTRFRNPSGLPDDEQVTTARDMVILGAALIYHYPQFYPYFSHESFVYAGLTHRNHNHLMERYDGMDGIKTGYIRASGFNLVASAKRNGTRLIGAVFGGRSTLARDNQMALLLDRAFERADGAPRMANNGDAQGDSADDDSTTSGYIKLPAKVAAIFPGKSAVARPADTGRTWGIQIGAYSDAAIARQSLASIIYAQPQLGNTSAQLNPVTVGSAMLYRATLRNMDQATAEQTCAQLTRQGQACKIIAP